MKQLMLTDLLNENQLKTVRDILNHPIEGIENTERLKYYLSWLKEELEAKEVDYEYLAYLLIHLHN